jgi:hypothetical protein
MYNATMIPPPPVPLDAARALIIKRRIAVMIST